MFCYNSRQDGVVKDITSSGIFVQYKDGTTENFEIGTIYGKAEGSVYPHQVVTDLKVGQKFKEGDNIVYNKGFFERDTLDPSAVIMKNSFTVKVALTETPQTHEDSCAISKAIGEELRANTTKVKSIVVDFDQGIHDLVKVGQKVNAKDPLMLISDSISEGLGFNDESLAALKKLSSQSPRAGYLGTIGRIEVLYNGEIDSMSESLRAIVKKSNSELASRYKVKGMSGVTGRVTDEYAIAGKPLTSNKAEIKIYINLSTHAGVGDKYIICPYV